MRPECRKILRFTALTIATLCIASISNLTKADVVSTSSSNNFDKALIKKTPHFTIYDGNKLKMARDAQSKEEDTIIFTDDFSQGLKNWDNVVPQSKSEVVYDSTLKQNVVKLDSKAEVSTKSLLPTDATPGFYRLTVTFKAGSTNLLPTFGFADGDTAAAIIGDQDLNWHTQSYVFSTTTNKLNLELGSNIVQQKNSETSDDEHVYMTNVKLEKISPTEQTNFNDGSLHGWTIANNVTSNYVNDSAKGKVLQLTTNKAFPIIGQESLPLIYKKDVVPGRTAKEVSGMTMFAEVSADLKDTKSEVATNIGTLEGIVGQGDHPDSLNDYITLGSWPFSWNQSYEPVTTYYGLNGFNTGKVPSKEEPNIVNVSKIDVYKGIINSEK